MALLCRGVHPRALGRRHRRYAELAAAARASHERMYAVASGQATPYAEAPRYLSKLFC